MIIDYINEFKVFRSDFQNENTNHLPMALFAMFKLGATKKELELFAEKYFDRQEFVKVTAPKLSITKENWEHNLGERDMYESYQEFYRKEVEVMGIEKCISHYFNLLSTGIASEAFHCFIKLAYAVESMNIEEIINALSYLSATIFSTPSNSFSIIKEVKRTDEIIFNLENSMFFKTKTFKGDNISHKIKEVFQDESFLEFVIIPDFSIENNMSYLKNSVLKLHLLKCNFTSLHLVTSLHALRILEKYSNNIVKLYQDYWVATLASIVTINDTKKAEKTALLCYSTDDWQTIHERAISTMDDHVIKLVYSCHEEYKTTGNYLYQIVASKSLK